MAGASRQDPLSRGVAPDAGERGRSMAFLVDVIEVRFKIPANAAVIE
jgi:hypothetical protein